MDILHSVSIGWYSIENSFLFISLFFDKLTATEAHDDDGLPHTLEHLIFLGSELYPYKGVLDLLANRCLASGTNAWTDTDHTCYTVQTVGKDGFLELMPIYLDHILHPTLSVCAPINTILLLQSQLVDFIVF